MLAFGTSGAWPLGAISTALRLAPWGVAAFCTENLETLLAGVVVAAAAAGIAS